MKFVRIKWIDIHKASINPQLMLVAVPVLHHRVKTLATYMPSTPSPFFLYSHVVPSPSLTSAFELCSEFCFSVPNTASFQSGFKVHTDYGGFQNFDLTFGDVHLYPTLHFSHPPRWVHPGPFII